MNKPNTEKLKVLDKQDTAEVEVTLQEISRAERGKITFEDLSAKEQDYLLQYWEEEYKEKRNGSK